MNTFLNILASPSENFTNTYFIIDFVLTVVILFLFTIFMATKLKNKIITILYIISDIIFTVSLALGLNYLSLFLMLMIVGSTIIFLFVNIGVIRKYVAIPLKKQAKNTNESSAEKEKLVTDICSAVEWLSKNKTGALITFERDTPLDEFIKSGTVINCPVTPEILETIFYEGTRLHDGACIIRGNVIVAAAVYYHPTNKAIMGKVGARHRAAIGISEETDAITIVVSEETGRISITHGGNIDHLKTDEFEKILRDQIIGN